MLLECSELSKYFGGEEIFSNLTAKIEDKSRIGLIGANGAGKSTLLRILCAQLEPDAGRISRKGGLRMGYLKQDSGLNPANTIMEEMRTVFEKELAMQARLEELAHQPSGALTEEYAHLQGLFEAREGYHIDVKISTILGGMGFTQPQRSKPIAALSGGEKTRLAICKLLLEEPELLILDEPTNHLDFRTLLWLEDYLTQYKGGILVVSHDRFFLDTLIDEIWELEDSRLYTYSGNYTKYLALKAERIERQQKLYDQQQEEIAHLEDYIARNMVRATTASRAKSKQNTLERIERIQRPRQHKRPLKLSFTYKQEPVKDVLQVEDLTVAVGPTGTEIILAQQLGLHMRRGEKIALVGANGMGKTTFLKALQNLHPANGHIEWGRNVKTTYFAQDNNALQGRLTALEQVHSLFPGEYEVTMRTALGSVGLSGDDVYKRVEQLSGGESARLKFVIMMLQNGNVLILDEPTNHLDLNAKEVLDKALADFPGTVLMVSHDRYLLNKVPTRIVEMTADAFVSYPGKFNDYMAATNMQGQTGARPQKPEDEAPAPQAQTEDGAQQGKTLYKGKEQRKAEAARKKALAEAEGEITRLEEIIARLEQELQTPEVMSDFVRLDEICEGLDNYRQQLAQQMDDWLEISSV